MNVTMVSAPGAAVPFTLSQVNRSSLGIIISKLVGFYNFGSNSRQLPRMSLRL